MLKAALIAASAALASPHLPPDDVPIESAAMALVTLEEGAQPGLRGEVRITIYDSKEAFLETPFAKRAAPLGVDGAARVPLNDLPPGRYAMAAYLDVDGDGELRRGGLLGKPKEPIGFSGGAKIALGAPAYKDAAVEVRPGAVIRIELDD